MPKTTFVPKEMMTYDSVGAFVVSEPTRNTDVAWARFRGRYLHIDRNGQPLHRRSFQRVRPFFAERAAVWQNGLAYHILTDGSPAYVARFRWVGRFKNGQAQVQSLDGEDFFIDLNGVRID
ncbi:hypothetical protein H6784_04760 [Candidatus Nomurabacteria bacterium]|nr:hypothetical protein [Candidatus Kaiserbacteria bacterium]MCB9814700.1 hypothetical protein [Candidatus Nomurabacteria bacterium]